MNKELIKKFRENVAIDNRIFCTYRDVNGKDHHGIICSAMDWIEVVINGISVENLLQKDPDASSINVISFISCVDILWEAIQQLYRVFYNEIPLREDTSVFHKNVSDNEYFKKIRACFAAHPVNLHQIYEDDKKGERWFASWSEEAFSAKGFGVNLYSNISGKEIRNLKICFNDLLRFAEKRYELLTNLIEKINQDIEAYNERWKNTPIEASGDDELKIIEVLIGENKKRFDNSNYDYELKKIKMVYSIAYVFNDKNNLAMKKYKEACHKEVDEIKNNLQSMELEDLKEKVEIRCPREYKKAFIKLERAAWGKGKHLDLHNYVEKIKEHINDYVDIEENMSLRAKYVLICAGLYSRSEEQCNGVKQ